LMLDRFLKLKRSVTLFLSEQPKAPTFSADEWENISDSVSSLRPLFEVTVELSNEKHSTVSKVCNWVIKVKSVFNNRSLI